MFTRGTIGFDTLPYMRTMENQTAQHPETSLDRQETDVGDVVTCHSLDDPNTRVVVVSDGKWGISMGYLWCLNGIQWDI